MKTVLNRLGSFKLTVPVLLFIAGTAALGTFLPRGPDLAGWEKLLGETGTGIAVRLGLTDFYHSAWFLFLLLLLVVNMLACMVNRIPGILAALSGRAALQREAVLDLPRSRETAERADRILGSLGFRGRDRDGDRIYSRGSSGYLFTLLSHGSILVIMAFSIYGSRAGFIATQRIYVGDTTGSAFNWKVGADRPLPFEIVVRDLNILPNPAGVRLGVLETSTGRKGKLITTHEGGEFRVPGLAGRFRLESFDIDEKVYSASWIRSDGSTVTVGSGDELGSSGLSLVLVAFASWPERQVTAAVTLISPQSGEAPGEISVNHPLVTGGVRIYLTDYGKDQYGLPYVGFQFVRDPGQAGVWAGCVLFLVSLSMAVFRRHSCVVLAGAGDRWRVYVSSRENREEIIRQLSPRLLPDDAKRDRGRP